MAEFAMVEAVRAKTPGTVLDDLKKRKAEQEQKRSAERSLQTHFPLPVSMPFPVVPNVFQCSCMDAGQVIVG